jgi:hypothetical protein
MNRLFLAVLMVLGVSACVPQVVHPQPPAVELLGFSLVALDPFTGKADFDVRLRLTNPNAFTLPLLDSTLTAELAGTQFRLTVPAVELSTSSPREVQTRLTVPVVQGTRALATLIAGQSTRFRLLGELRVQLGPATVPVGPLTFVDRDVQLQLAFQLPIFRVVSLSLDGLTLRVSLEVQNPNPIGFTLSGPLRVLVGGRSVAETSFNLPLAPNSSNRGEFRLGLSGFPGVGGISLDLGLTASVPGILDRPVSQVVQGFLR